MMKVRDSGKGRRSPTKSSTDRKIYVTDAMQDLIGSSICNWKDWLSLLLHELLLLHLVWEEHRDSQTVKTAQPTQLADKVVVFWSLPFEKETGRENPKAPAAHRQLFPPLLGPDCVTELIPLAEV